MSQGSAVHVHRSLSSSFNLSGGFGPMLQGKTPSRCFLNSRASECTVEYPVLDVGGSPDYSYYDTMRLDEARTVSVNLPREPGAAVFANVEQSLPFTNDSFPTILCFNLLEHLYRYETLLVESHRVLDPEGRAYFYVPFSQRIHGDPHDYTRFTPERLRRELLDAGFESVAIQTLDPGPLSAAVNALLPVLKFNLLKFASWRVANVGDGIVHRINDALQERQPIGIFATAKP